MPNCTLLVFHCYYQIVKLLSRDGMFYIYKVSPELFVCFPFIGFMMITPNIYVYVSICVYTVILSKVVW